MSTSDLWPLAWETLGALGGYYGPAMAQAAGEVLPAGEWYGWLFAALMWEPEPLSAERLAVRAPYTALLLHRNRLARGVELGMLAPVAEGEYHLTDAGHAAIHRIIAAAYAVMVEPHPRPLAELERLTGLLRRLVEASLAAAEPAVKGSLRLSRRIDPGASAPILAQIDQYLSDLNAFRDDAHVASWRPQGVGGPAWEAFTYLWRGQARTVDDLVTQLAFRHHTPTIYADALQDLVGRGWVVETDGGASTALSTGYEVTAQGQTVRQAAVEKTDRVFFAPWGCLDEGELGELKELLAGLRDGLKTDG
jgi:hypothetical protein